MDVKMHRYMQRIEKIIHTPTKATNNISPIRPTKTPLKNKPNQLDKYIKYELSAKIINNIINRNHQQLVMLFFNMLRNTEYRQKQKIYKFVAIQRQEMRVDLGIAAKLLNAVLKQLVKKRFSHFLFNSQIDRPLQSAFKKFLVEQSNNTSSAAELIRTSSLNNKVPPKQPTEWFQDMETENQKKKLLKKIQGFRGYTGKVIMRNVKQSYQRLLKKAFQNIRWAIIQSNTLKFEQNGSKTMQNQVKIWQQKQKNFLRQIQQLSQKLTKCETLLLKQSTMKMSESDKNKTNEAKSKVKLQNCQNNFYCFVSRKMDRQKYRFLQQIKNLFMQLAREKRNTLQLRLQNKVKKPSLYDASSLILQVLRLADKKKLHYQSYFFKRISQSKTSQKQQQKYDYLRLNYDAQQRSTSSRNIANKSNLKISVFSNSQTVTPKVKPNFHLFVDKIFKLILVISKLLIPLRQGFDRINQYAFYSYQIQQKFKAVVLRNLKQSFQRINQYTKKDNSRMLLLSKLSVLQGVVRQKLVESFSHIKILSRENDLKIKLIPVKLHIVQTTKQFIQQRKIYSQYSLQNWSKLRQNLLQDVKSSSLDKQKKKTITSTI